MADLLLELFSEEIPARMQEDALAHLTGTLAAKLKEAGITTGEMRGFVTPRRLAVWIKNLPVAQAASESEVKGPKTNAPDAALAGFLKKNNIEKADLTERDGTYFAIIKKEGRQTKDALKTIIEDILHAFPWPKSMRWGSGEVAWVRPLHSILCIFDGEIIPVSFAGVNAGNTTRGHRFLAPAEITVTNPAEYEAALEKACVIADREKRKASILDQAQKAAAGAGLALKKDDGLLSEVTGLVEWPVVLVGSIDAKFMDLPKEVLVSEMRAHQKYFALLKPSPSGRGQGEGVSTAAMLNRPHPNPLPEGEGELAPSFLITSNMKSSEGGKAIIAGNERVLRARLSDGRFFWDQDRKKPLSDWAEGLKTVTFHAKLGTIADKVARIEKLALQLAPLVKADTTLVQQAARLCKADLTTGMVGEFPELQGVMGRYYAVAQKEESSVADAIRDHYKPQGPSDSVPTNPVAVCVALADKLDTLVSMFAIGEKPTGSKDPFALRRAALGDIRIIRENNVRCDLSKIIVTHAALVLEQLKIQKIPLATGISSSETVAIELLGFLAERLIVQLKDEHIQHDIIKGVFARGEGDIVRLIERAKALQNFLGTDDGSNLLVAYRRAANIVGIEEKKDNVSYDNPGISLGANAKQEDVDLVKLFSANFSVIKTAITEERFTDAMANLAILRRPVDAFFDNVLINDPDEKLRVMRLNILARLREIFNMIADFSKIEGDSKEQKKAA